MNQADLGELSTMGILNSGPSAAGLLKSPFECGSLLWMLPPPINIYRMH